MAGSVVAVRCLARDPFSVFLYEGCRGGQLPTDGPAPRSTGCWRYSWWRVNWRQPERTTEWYDVIAWQGRERQQTRKAGPAPREGERSRPDEGKAHPEAAKG